MAFALVEFADKSLAVVETANITTAAGEKVTDCGQDCGGVEGTGKEKEGSYKACCDSDKIWRYVQQFAVDRVP